MVMKRLFLLAATILLTLSFGYSQKDTSCAGIYYYNASSYGIMSRDSANYYRVVEKNNSFNDYYASDNTLRASGTVTYVDPSDDGNTIFDGSFIAYYPSGRVWIKQFFKEGQNDGEFTEYYENGLMKQHEFYKNGVLNGVKTTFDEKGETCTQWEYKDGVLVNDYYTKSGNGYSVDYDTTSNAPKWRDVTTSDLKVVVDKNGKAWKTYAINGLYVSIDLKYRKFYGRYYVLELFIQNNSQESAFFNFSQSTINTNRGDEKFFTEKEFYRRVRNRQGWANFGIQAAGVATAITLDVALNSNVHYSHNPHHRHHWERDLVYDMSSFLIHQSAIVGSILVSGFYADQREKILNTDIGYLRNYSIEPKSSITGYAYAKYSPNAKSVLVNLFINGKVYQFPMDASHLEVVD